MWYASVNIIIYRYITPNLHGVERNGLAVGRGILDVPLGTHVSEMRQSNTEPGSGPFILTPEET